MRAVGIRISVEGLDRDIADGTGNRRSFERDERYWYSDGWRQLRRNLVRLCLQESGDLLHRLCSENASSKEIDQAVRTFVDRVLGAVRQRAEATSSADIWRHSLRLFALHDRLSMALIKQKKQFAATDRDLDPEAMLGAILKSHFETMRRDLQTEHSPHRLKVWEQIDRISRELLGLGDDPSTSRSTEHLEAVLRALGERYPNSRNLPRSITTLESYFLEFSPFFQPESLDGRVVETLADDRGMTADDLDFLEDVTGMKPDPMTCFEALPEQHAQVFAVAHRLTGDLLPESKTPFTSARAYYLNSGISKRQFYRLLREATNLLIACLERNIQRVS